MTGHTRRPKSISAALGVRSHSGWAAYVVLAGNPANPEILSRGHMMLCDPAIQGSEQPFHEAEPMRSAAAQKFIARCTASTAKLTAKAIGDIHSAWPFASCCVLTASGRPLPGLRNILASHTLIHSAEGDFYRDAVAAACVSRGIALHRLRERDMEIELQRLPIAAPRAKEQIAEFGKRVGPPWTQDEKLAAAGAWLMLAQLPSRGLRR